MFSPKPLGRMLVFMRWADLNMVLVTSVVKMYSQLSIITKKKKQKNTKEIIIKHSQGYFGVTYENYEITGKAFLE